MKQISVNELYPKWLRHQEGGEACTVIDVREVGEYQQGHVPEAVLIPLSTVTARTHEIPKEDNVYVICRSGGRSAQAIQYLMQECGHQNLINVAGGTMAWVEAAYPVQEGA